MFFGRIWYNPEIDFLNVYFPSLCRPYTLPRGGACKACGTILKNDHSSQLEAPAKASFTIG